MLNYRVVDFCWKLCGRFESNKWTWISAKSTISLFPLLDRLLLSSSVLFLSHFFFCLDPVTAPILLLFGCFFCNNHCFFFFLDNLLKSVKLYLWLYQSVSELLLYTPRTPCSFLTRATYSILCFTSLIIFKASSKSISNILWTAAHTVIYVDFTKNMRRTICSMSHCLANRTLTQCM